MRTSRRELTAMKRQEREARGRSATILAGAALRLAPLRWPSPARPRRRSSTSASTTGPTRGSSFDGTGSVGPGRRALLGVHQMDINQANGDFIVGNNNYWYKFNSAGHPSAFSALGTTTMVGTDRPEQLERCLRRQLRRRRRRRRRRTGPHLRACRNTKARQRLEGERRTRFRRLRPPTGFSPGCALRLRRRSSKGKSGPETGSRRD